MNFVIIMLIDFLVMGSQNKDYKPTDKAVPVCVSLDLPV